MSSEPQQQQQQQRATGHSDGRSSGDGEGALVVGFDGRSSAVLRIEARYPLKLMHAIDRHSQHDSHSSNSLASHSNTQQSLRSISLLRLPAHVPPVVQMLGYGGGLLSADRLSLKAQLTPHATLLLTTPAHGRAYKQRLQQQQSTQPAGSVSSEVSYSFHLGPSSLLLLAPFPVSLFANSSLATRCTVHMHSSASALLFDAITGGRHTRGEQFGHVAHSATTTLFIDDHDQHVPAVRDRSVLSGRPCDDDANMAGRYKARGTVLLIGPHLLPLAVELYLTHNQRTVRVKARSKDAAAASTECVVSAAWVCGNAPDLLPADCPVDSAAIERCLGGGRVSGGCLVRVLSVEVESLLQTVGSLLAALDWHMQGVAPWQRV